MKIFNIARNTYKESVRNKFLYGAIFLIALVFSVASFLGSVSIGSRKDVIIDFGVFTLSFFCSILSIINGVTLFNKELKHKTIYNILSKPVTRGEFVIGKFFGLFFCSLALLLLITLGIFFIIYFLENELYFNILLASYFSALELSIICAFVILFSTFSTSPFLPGFLSFSLYIIGHSLEYLMSLLVLGDSSINSSMVNTIFWILPDLSLFNLSKNLIYNVPIDIQQIIQASIYGICYTAIVLFISCFIFQRKEIN